MEREQLWPMKTAIRALQVFTVILIFTYTYHFYHFVEHSGLTFSNKTDYSSTSVVPLSLRRGNDLKDWLKSNIICDNKSHQRKVYQKLNYWVVENFVRATHGNLDCQETVTWTTQAEYHELHHLIALVQRWKAPISVALYCPLEDYKNCVDTLVFLRFCLPVDSQRYFLRKYLSVHIYFEDHTVPSNIYYGINYSRPNCYENPMDRPSNSSSKNNLYRQNVARNIAKSAALTHFVLASDINMLPSSKLSDSFMENLPSSGFNIHHHPETIFVLAAFDMVTITEAPKSKEFVQKALLTGAMIEANGNSECLNCKRIVDIEEWTNNSGFTTKKLKSHDLAVWEPFYIASRDNPYFDEQLVKTNQQNPHYEAFRVCSSGFKFAVLNDGYLVRQIDRQNRYVSRRMMVQKIGKKGIDILGKVLDDINYQCRSYIKFN